MGILWIRLIADLASSVTVVEWGEGLVESLAGSYLTIGIQAAPAAGQDQDSDAEAGDEPSQPRTVRISGWGTRWRQAAPQALQTLVSSR